MTAPRSHTLAANHAPVFGWGFMAVWMMILTGMTYVFLRDGGIPEIPYPLAFAVLALFWLFGVLASTFFFAIPRTSVVFEGQDFVVREHWLVGTRSERLRTLDAKSVLIREEEDSDGAAYFVCVLVTPSARRIKLHESHLRPLAEQARTRLLDGARDIREGGPVGTVRPTA